MSHSFANSVTRTLVTGTITLVLARHASCFLAVAENTAGVIQVNAARRLFATMALNKEAGLVTSEHFESERAVMRSFLMLRSGLDGTVDEPSGKYRDARNTLMPEGMMKPKA